MKKILCILICASLVFVFASCSEKNSSSDTDSTSANTAQASETSVTSENTPQSDGNYDLSFSDRDCDSSYDENSTKITFTDSSAKADSVNGVTVNGTNITITTEGTYILSGECSDGSVVIETDDKSKVQLVLDNLNLSSKNSPLVIKEADKVFITLANDSSNTLSDSSSYSLTIDDSTVDSAIFSKADLAINGGGSLTVNGNYKHGIVSKDDLIITGGTINVSSKSSGIDGKDCVKIKSASITVDSGTDSIRSTNIDETDSRGFVYINSGSFSLTSTNDAIQAASMLRIDGGNFDITTGGGSTNGKTHTESMGRGMDMFSSSSDSEDTESAKALKAAGNIKVNGGTYNINSSDDSIHSNSDVIITNCDFTAQTGDDGIHADNALTIDGGTINITQSYEGIEAGDIIVNDGKINVVSSDDGFNAAGGSDGEVEQGAFNSDSGKSLTVNGGYVVVDASGDGLDSNGSLSITGGIILVSGPENSGNGALDYNTSASITGGTLIALGSSGMAQSITGDGQCTIMTDITSQSADTMFALCDSNSNVIASFKPAKQYSNIVVSSPSIKTGETYKIVCGGTVDGADENGFADNGTLTSGTEITEITMSEENYSSGVGSMNGGMGGPNGDMRGGPGGMTPR